MAFALRRLGHAVPLLLLVSLLVFGLLHAAPGDPLEQYLANPNVRPEDVARLRTALGLDRPLPEQYVRWLAGALRGEWGVSLVDGRPVFARIAERVPATFELVAAGLVVSLAAAVPAALVSARRRPRWLARVVDAAAVAGISLPVFWLGLALQLIFAVWLGWLPAAGRTSLGDGSWVDRAQHLVLPATVLAAVHAAAWMRYLRASLRDVLPMPFVRAARARGLGASRVLWRHALRTAWGPFVAVAMLDAALLLSGAVVTESVFAWPGLGSLFTDAIARRDYPVLMAFLMLAATAVIAANLVADVVQARLDPRSR
ncbi:MAG: ABC transporter permease [Gemmatimonadaceae bacterium]|jgi:peptide/nickel transport system permease protein|nr:ABC transporter permease [Gemmatimonadaceae bacterium]